MSHSRRGFRASRVFKNLSEQLLDGWPIHSAGIETVLRFDASNVLPLDVWVRLRRRRKLEHRIREGNVLHLYWVVCKDDPTVSKLRRAFATECLGYRPTAFQWCQVGLLFYCEILLPFL